MRPLYPSAHHDRFSHSLGVYHLGSIAFRHLKHNSRSDFSEINGDDWNRYEITFQIACLLHDCAHAPFSHIFEHYYKRHNGDPEYLDNTIREASNSAEFNSDYARMLPPAPHEVASAVILLRHFRKKIESLGGDPLLAARMITGCQHFPVSNDQHRLENCLILLLNGKAIDVDKLDYIIRDTWASGVNNASIDVHRLLTALRLAWHENRLVLAFNKSALSVVKNVVDGRNFLYQWIYSHHTVVYNKYILDAAVNKLARILSKNSATEFLDGFFSLDALQQSIDVNGTTAYLPSDGDLIYLLKRYKDQIEDAREWLSRKYDRVPLWKSYPEYKLIFEGIGAEEAMKIGLIAEEQLENSGIGPTSDTPFMVCKVETKTVSISTSDLFIDILNKVLSYTKLFEQDGKGVPDYFYVYVPKECGGYKDDFIGRLRNLI